jgi:hypothetical protein
MDNSIASTPSATINPVGPDFIGPLLPEQMLALGRFWYDEFGQANLYVGDGDSHLELRQIYLRKRRTL